MTQGSYYPKIVSFLERLEARQVQNTPTGAYLVWRDDDGPWMVAGPDIDWFRGDGPLPDLPGLTMSATNKPINRARPNRAPNTSEGSATAQCSSHKADATKPSAGARPNRAPNTSEGSATARCSSNKTDPTKPSATAHPQSKKTRKQSCSHRPAQPRHKPRENHSKAPAGDQKSRKPLKYSQILSLKKLTIDN